MLADTFPFVIIPVFEPVSLKRVLTPIQRRFDGLALPTPTFPDVTREFIEFVNWMVFEVVLPYPAACASVRTTGVDTMLVMRPVASTTIWGMLEVDPYVAAVVTPATFERNWADP